MAVANFYGEFSAFVATTGGLSEGTNLFKDKLPDTPHQATVLRYFGGRAPEGESGLFSPSVQVLTRAKTTAAARSANGGLYDVLHSGASGTYRFDLPNFECHAVQAVGIPARVGEDEQRREQFAFTLQMHAQPK